MKKKSELGEIAKELRLIRCALQQMVEIVETFAEAAETAVSASDSSGATAQRAVSSTSASATPTSGSASTGSSPDREAGSGKSGTAESPQDLDSLYDIAKKLTLREGKVSTVYLQLKFEIGYARAAKLLDLLEKDGVIGPAIGALPRRVINKLSPEAKSVLSKIEKQLKKKGVS